ncbi:hypothetical protein LCGC14_1135400 [marine sediment metagenome]|uniref:Uncharacterized protein n=1 Tax=marine sediment metagenome TaxID=412755 RepID=A0A0F9Q5I8_9ZZZZ
MSKPMTSTEMLEAAKARLLVKRPETKVNLRFAARDGSHFRIAHGADGYIATSEDGTTWTER